MVQDAAEEKGLISNGMEGSLGLSKRAEEASRVGWNSEGKEHDDAAGI